MRSRSPEQKNGRPGAMTLEVRPRRQIVKKRGAAHGKDIMKNTYTEARGSKHRKMTALPKLLREG